MQATITNIYGCVKSEKNGKYILATRALIPAQTSFLGQGSEEAALVNISLTELSQAVKDMMSQDETNENRFHKTDACDNLEIKVAFRQFRADADAERNIYWATV